MKIIKYLYCAFIFCNSIYGMDFPNFSNIFSGDRKSVPMGAAYPPMQPPGAQASSPSHQISLDEQIDAYLATLESDDQNKQLPQESSRKNTLNRPKKRKRETEEISDCKKCPVCAVSNINHNAYIYYCPQCISKPIFICAKSFNDHCDLNHNDTFCACAFCNHCTATRSGIYLHLSKNSCKQSENQQKNIRCLTCEELGEEDVLLTPHEVVMHWQTNHPTILLKAGDLRATIPIHPGVVNFENLSEHLASNRENIINHAKKPTRATVQKLNCKQCLIKGGLNHNTYIYYCAECTSKPIFICPKSLQEHCKKNHNNDIKCACAFCGLIGILNRVYLHMKNCKKFENPQKTIRCLKCQETDILLTPKEIVAHWQDIHPTEISLEDGDLVSIILKKNNIKADFLHKINTEPAISG